MRRRLSLFIFFILFALSAPFLLAQSIPDNVRELIEKKTQELNAIEAQKKALENNLNEINKSNSKLTKEIKTMDNQISQINLGIKASALAVEKLELELKELSKEVETTDDNIQIKKNAISKLFGELQQKSNENFLVIFLRNKSLAESVGEVESIALLNSKLNQNIKELTNLQDELQEKLVKEGEKKQNKEVEKSNLTNKQYILQDQKKDKQTLLSQTKNQEKIYEKQLEEVNKLQAEISKDIEAIEVELRKTIDPNLLPLARSGVLAWPVPDGKLTQGYGVTSFALKNYASGYHNGIDIGAPIGTEIISSEDGTVINAGNQDLYCKGAAYGKFIVIKHTNGLTTLYGHMSRTLFSTGQKVSRGQVIGYVGRTGWATGPHLHYTVFASQTLTPARHGYPEGTKPSRVCGPMPVGGDLNPTLYF